LIITHYSVQWTIRLVGPAGDSCCFYYKMSCYDCRKIAIIWC